MTTERPLGSSYVLQDVIGRGAMGQVWRGRDAEGHQLAFKLLRPELTQDPKVVQRFVQERSILTSIRHPNVVSVRDLVVEGETLAIVMDLVEGGDLREMLSGPRTLPPARVAELGAGIAAGLAAVHAAGVIHRDVKPENVLIDASSGPGRPRLTDFGIAKYVAQDGARRAGTMLVGTPQYIAPELIDGKEPTSATDLYALGIMLYELACGVTPFAGGSTMAVLRNHAERLPGRPPGVPDSLWDLISWLLGKHAASRPQSASQVATLLDALVPELAGLPAAEALHEPPEPEPSVHTQLTEMAMRPVTTAPVAVDAGRPDPARADPTPRMAARRRRVVLIGALSGALILLGGGFAAALLMRGPAQTHGLKAQATGPRIASPSTSPRTTASTSTPSPSASPATTSAGISNANTSAPVRNLPATGATVTVSESAGVPTWTGPNDDTSRDGSAVFHQVGSLAPGSIVAIICTVYGRPSTVYAGSQSRLWDYTSAGYVPDSALHAGGSSPASPTCAGTLAQTHAGSEPPSQESGPYPLYNNGNQVDIFDSPSTSANLQGQLQDGTYVHLVCSSPGSPVLGPTDMYGTPVGSSTNWNRIDAPVIGWVSDAFVDSASATSVAPRC
jgi:serine/threonine protein kinase